MTYKNRRTPGTKDQYIHPEEDLHEEQLPFQKDTQKIGFVPIEQAHNPNREEEFYDKIDRNSHAGEDFTVEELAGQELVDTLMATDDEWTIYEYIQEHPEMREYIQHNYPDFFDAEGKEKDPMEYYRQHYPEYFPEERQPSKEIKKEE